MNKHPHEKITRNELILKLFRKEVKQADIADVFDITRQRVNTIINKSGVLRENKKEIIPVDIIKEEYIKGIYLGEKEFSSNIYGYYTVLEFEKRDGEKVYLIKYFDLSFYDWDNYIDKTVEVNFLARQFDDLTEKIEPIFSVYVENKRINIACR